VQDTWTLKSPIPTSGRVHSFGFSIGTKGYIGSGYDSSFNKLKDFWEWDQFTNIWTQKTDFGGGFRTAGTGFAIGNSGYAGLGFDENSDLRKDFWKYDPGANSWIQILDFGGGPESSASSFSMCGKGYVGIGRFNTQKELWEYDPGNNSWTQKANIGGFNRSAAVGFSINIDWNEKGYIATGYVQPNDCSRDLWEFSPNICTPLLTNNSSTRENSYFLFPSPSSGVLTLKSASDISDIEILNVLGVKVLEGKTTGITTIYDLSHQPKGIYFVRLLNGTKVIATEKILIDK
jgi:hypothetical protein